MSVKLTGSVSWMDDQGTYGRINYDLKTMMDGPAEFWPKDVISGGPLKVGQKVKFTHNKVQDGGYYKNVATEVEGL